ncbi:hypothetical protein CsSME_00054078 [Camellia sinensis var. sinensis]
METGKQLILLNESPGNPSSGSATKFSGDHIKISKAAGKKRIVTVSDFWKIKKLSNDFVINDQGFVTNQSVKRRGYRLANGVHIAIEFPDLAKILWTGEKDLITP